MAETREPRIEWNGKEWFVALPIDDGQVVEARITPSFTYVCRYRECGAEEWSAGFESPLTTCSLTGLKPDTEYELQVCMKDQAGVEGYPALSRLRTNPEGSAGNVIPFPGPK